MPILSFEIPQELDSFITAQVESGAFKDASSLVVAALRALEREEEDNSWKLFAIEKAIDEGDASGIAEGDVFEQIRTARKPRREERVALG